MDNEVRLISTPFRFDAFLRIVHENGWDKKYCIYVPGDYNSKFRRRIVLRGFHDLKESQLIGYFSEEERAMIGIID